MNNELTAEWRHPQTSSADGWTANPGAQTEVLRRREKELLYGGARGGGKTEAGLAWLAEPEYITKPTFRSLVIRKDYDDLSDWIFRAKTFYGDRCEIVGKPAEIRWRAGGITRLGHWKDRDTISKYIGHEYWKMLFEELTQSVSTLEEYQMLLGSCRSSEPDIMAQIFATTNPGGPGHNWVKRYWIDCARKRVFKDPGTGYTRLFIPSKAKDNPHIDAHYLRWLDGLPERIRAAWRDGSWEMFEGQYFVEFGPHLKEEPFQLQPSQIEGRMFGSLDSGTAHDTAFGLWWIDLDNTLHRLMTYCGNGMTIRAHAEEIYNRVESFCNAWASGYWPELVVFDPSMQTKVRLNEAMVRSPIDEYQDHFAGRGKHLMFEPANNEKPNACQTMRLIFSGHPNAPKLRYFDKFNRSFEEGIGAVMVDKNNREIYQKQDGDDIADEARYGITKGCSMIGMLKQRIKDTTPKTHLEKLLAGEMAPRRATAGNWYDG